MVGNQNGTNCSTSRLPFIPRWRLAESTIRVAVANPIFIAVDPFFVDSEINRECPDDLSGKLNDDLGPAIFKHGDWIAIGFYSMVTL
jgi:hypothetical protein